MLISPLLAQQSLLLDEEEGCTAFRRAIQDLCSGEVMCTPALCAFREKAVKLLFLERNAFRWYREVRPQVGGVYGLSAIEGMGPLYSFTV